MQVTETLNSGLKREIKVVIPSADLNEKLTKKLEDAKARVRINGFRPGKVPVQYLRKMHGPSFMAEVLDEIFNQTPPTILADRGERSATAPKIDVDEDEAQLKQLLAGKSDLTFTMNYEILPSVEVKDHAAISVVRETVTLADSVVEERVNTIAQMTRSYTPKEGAAEKGDRVSIDYKGTAEGLDEPVSQEDVHFIVGEEGLIIDFNEAVIGRKAGDEVSLTREFADEFLPMPALAGKKVTFDISLKKIESADELVIDDDTAKKIGFESLEKLREAVRENMEGEYKDLARQRVKRQILDALDKDYQFEVPSTLVEVEFNNIWTQFMREMEQEGSSFEKENTTEAEARAEYQALAERRVRLGLVLSEIGKQADVTITDEEFLNHVKDFIRRYPAQEKQILETLRSNPDAVAGLRAPLYEDKVIEHLLSIIQVEEKQLTPEELVAAEEAYEAEQLGAGKDQADAPEPFLVSKSGFHFSGIALIFFIRLDRLHNLAQTDIKSGMGCC